MAAHYRGVVRRQAAIGAYGKRGMTSAADGLLYLLRANPSLLPPAPADVDAWAMERRRHDTVQTVATTLAERATMEIAADLMRGHADRLDLIMIGDDSEGVS